jgi:hypothetical protein
MRDLVLENLLHLYATIILPTTLWIIATAHIYVFGAPLPVRESLCDTVIEQICKLHHDPAASNMGLPPID